MFFPQFYSLVSSIAHLFFLLSLHHSSFSQSLSVSFTSRYSPLHFFLLSLLTFSSFYDYTIPFSFSAFPFQSLTFSTLFSRSPLTIFSRHSILLLLSSTQFLRSLLPSYSSHLSFLSSLSFVHVAPSFLADSQDINSDSRRFLSLNSHKIAHGAISPSLQSFKSLSLTLIFFIE